MEKLEVLDNELLSATEVEECFQAIVEQLSEQSELISRAEIEELENIPVLKPGGVADQGYRYG